MDFNKKEFWDRKILGWEKDKYLASGGLGRAININRSLQVRRKIALASLAPLAKDKVVIEAGCGSALLMEAFLTMGVKKYIGIDLSSAAIDEGKKRIPVGEESRVELICQDIVQYGEGHGMQGDILLSLGLLDWLAEEEIIRFLKLYPCSHYLHSFSEKRNSVSQWIHKMYVFTLYGHKERRYVPAYYTEKELQSFFEKGINQTPELFRSRFLEFGCLAHNLEKIIQ